MSRPISRRQMTGLLTLIPFVIASRGAIASSADLQFGELYGKVSVLGLEFSDKLKNLAGQDITMSGFMAPPLKAEAAFFVLTEIPMSICPFCSSDSDWLPH